MMKMGRGYGLIRNGFTGTTRAFTLMMKFLPKLVTKTFGQPDFLSSFIGGSAFAPSQLFL